MMRSISEPLTCARRLADNLPSATKVTIDGNDAYVSGFPVGFTDESKVPPTGDRVKREGRGKRGIEDGLKEEGSREKTIKIL